MDADKGCANRIGTKIPVEVSVQPLVYGDEVSHGWTPFDGRAARHGGTRAGMNRNRWWYSPSIESHLPGGRSMTDTLDHAHAEALDRQDPLASFRERFYVQPGTIYMDGNSLGLLS